MNKYNQKTLKAAEEFEKGYAERCGISINELRNIRKRVVIECSHNCMYSGCEGFNSISKKLAIEDELDIILPTETAE